ncbi:MAG: hypothetical protein COT14_01460 [Candidatus Diapherotrites archaeon CG08_land_8_20_14_0_20_30_16]|nr:MAG: hypothetical protein COT14_01460 [Candidatus Diapherotrites archaeon CG08_land_8_20_14_0_20_30_16]
MGTSRKGKQRDTIGKERKPLISRRALERTALRDRVESLRKEVMTLTPHLKALEQEIRIIKREIFSKIERGEHLAKKDYERYLDVQIAYYSMAVRQFSYFDEVLKITKTLGLQTDEDLEITRKNLNMIITRRAILKEFVALRADLDRLDGLAFAERFASGMSLINNLMNPSPEMQ